MPIVGSGVGLGDGGEVGLGDGSGRKNHDISVNIVSLAEAWLRTSFIFNVPAPGKYGYTIIARNQSVLFCSQLGSVVASNVLQ